MTPVEVGNSDKSRCSERLNRNPSNLVKALIQGNGSSTEHTAALKGDLAAKMDKGWASDVCGLVK
jgi:hypothetical protein